VKGDSTQDVIFHAVGLALTQWETAENALATLFLVVSESENANTIHALRRAFGSIESGAARRKALEAAAEVYFGSSWTNNAVRVPFRNLIDSFASGSHRRDEIAHGMAVPVTIDGKEMGAFLFPAEYNTQRTFTSVGDMTIDPLAFMRGKYRYTAANIHEFVTKFGQLRDAIYGYIPSIRRVGGTPAQVLDSQFGAGTSKKVEGLMAEQAAKRPSEAP
jgi:hypothetical protein